jgi:hypothetical protein
VSKNTPKKKRIAKKWGQREREREKKKGGKKRKKPTWRREADERGDGFLALV